jgi:hydrogenase/urease accessory protein HupE
MRSFVALFAALAAAAVLLCARPARAHAVGLSNGEYRVDGASVFARLVFSSGEAKRAKMSDVSVRGDGAECALASTESESVENDGVAIRARWTCNAAPAQVSIDLERLLEELPSGHRHVVRAFGAGALDRICHRGDASFTFGASQPAARAQSPSAIAFVGMGFEHILTGHDHLLFLFGLVLVGGRLRSVLATVTAFTAAHSITLGLASLGVWAPSPRIVEPLIALSIAYVGVENLLAKSGERRWRVTFPFGLVHGFGFAGALREIELPRAEVPTALLTFNLGVELGQLAVLALVLPLLARARSFGGFEPRGVRVLSAGVALAGLVWFVQRLLV